MGRAAVWRTYPGCLAKALVQGRSALVEGDRAVESPGGRLLGEDTMVRRSAAVAGTIVAAGVVVAAVLRGPIKTFQAVGTLPGRTGSRINSHFGRLGYEMMARELELGPDDDLLDVACGWGEFLVVHATQARHVAGIDGAAEKVALARERLADRIAAGTAEVAHGDVTDLPWEDDTFSAVTCMDAFQFFPDPATFLAETLRVLRPGGRALMQVGMRWPEGTPFDYVASDVVDISDEQSLREFFENAGFGEVTMSYGASSATRVGSYLSLTLMGSDDVRVVRAVKPA